MDRPLLHVPADLGGQELSASGVEGLQASGVNGAGVKIAVIDVGFVGFQAAIDSGDLPSRYPGQTVFRAMQRHRAWDGGRGARPRHGARPLSCTSSASTASSRLQLAVNYVINQHIPIISHSITWLAGGRGDGVHNRTDKVSPDSIAKKAYDHGILWVNAAGNYAQSHWSGPYRHRPGSVFQDFGGGDEGNTFTIPGKTTGCASLVWDDWPQTDQDFNL